MTKDNSVRIAELQKGIEDYIGMAQKGVVFDFEEKAGVVTLHAITVNPRHNQSFLFHTTKGVNKIEALEALLAYVKSYKEKESSYTIQWSANGDSELQTSYFRAKNVLGALDKLYFQRDPNTMTIFSVILNPIA
jgi:hypothetical protein